MSKQEPFNHANYESVREYLKTSLEHVIDAGHSVREFSDFTLDKFGDTFTPYLRQFLNDVQQGVVTVKGLSKTSSQAILGMHVTAEERDAMIREAAYYQAEKHGFSPGREEEDWRAAEREVDDMLVQKAGLVSRGRNVVESSLSIIEREFSELKSVISDWLDQNVAVATSPAKKASPKKAVKKKAVTKKATAKKAAPKKAASKKAVKKKAAPAPKKAVKKKTTVKK